MTLKLGHLSAKSGYQISVSQATAAGFKSEASCEKAGDTWKWKHTDTEEMSSYLCVKA